MINQHERYDSPVLLHLERLGEQVPGDAVACTTCPVSVWYTEAGDALICFCPALHRDTWGARCATEPVRFCDAREQALAQLAVER